MKKIRNLDAPGRKSELAKTRKELNERYSQLSAGGSIDNPASIKELKRSIARHLTVMREESEL